MGKENITPGWDDNLINIRDDPGQYGFTAPTGASTQAIEYYDRQGNRLNYGNPNAYFTSPTGGYTYQGFPSGGVENTGLIYEDDTIFQDPYLVQLDQGVKVNPRDYGWKKSAYDYYLGGGRDAAADDFNIQAGDIDIPLSGGGGGGGGGNVVNQLGTVDEYTGINTLADIDTGVGEFDDLGPSPDYSNVTTAVAPPSILNPPISNLQTMAEVNALNDPRYYQTVAEDTGEIGRQNVSGNITDYLTGQTPPGGGDPEMYYDAPETYDPVEPGLDYLDLVGQDNTIESTMPQGSPRQLNPYEPENFLADPTINRIQDYDYIPETTLGDVFTTEARADEVTTGRPDMLGDTGAGIDYMSGSLDAPYGVNPNTGIPYETPRTISDQLLGQTFEADEVDAQGNLLQKGLEKLKSIIPNFDPMATAIKLGVNTLVGQPISLLADVMQNLPSSDPYTAEVLTDKYGVTEDGKIAGNPADNVFAGMNAVSMFGDPIQGAQDRVDTLQNTYDNYDNQWSNLKETDPDKFYQQKQNIKNKLDNFKSQLNEVENELGDVTGDQEGMTIAEDLAQKTRTEYRDEMADIETGDASLAERIEAEKRAAREEVQRIENERAATVRENARAEVAREAAQRAEDEARARAREEARKPAPPAPTYTQPSPHRPDRPSGDNQPQSSAPTNVGNPFGWNAGGRVRYGLGSLRKRRY